MQRFFWVCLAGALGTGVRYAIGLWAGQRFESPFPTATLIVNLIGCLLIAFIMQLALRLATFPPDLRVILTTGFMGGLTTYSAFNYETTKLWLSGARSMALLNFGVTVVGCLVAGLIGLVLAQRVSGG